jgi:hypothetical protein
MSRRSEDRLDNRVYVAEHVIIPESQNQEAERFEIGGTIGILGATLRMLSAIKLDEQTC